MKFQKRTSVAGQFAKKGVDIVNGDTVKLLDEGQLVQGQFGEQNVFKIETKNGERIMSINQTSINSLVDEYGEESANWVDKKVIIHVIKQNVAGKFIDVYYVAPEGYTMGENGFVKEKDIPVVTEGDDEVKISDVPF